MSSRSRQPANIPYSNFWLVAAEDAVRPRASENRKNYANAVGSKEKRSKRCIMTAKEMSWKMNISVVDSGANQIFFEKMDGAYLGSGDIALHKAQTSARFPFPTRGIEQLAYGKDLKGGMVPGLALVPGIIAFAGGLPIMTEDKVQIGAIGVSGGTADQDETCAQAGIEAAKDALK